MLKSYIRTITFCCFTLKGMCFQEHLWNIEIQVMPALYQ